MRTDRFGNTRRQKCCAKGSGKEVKVQEFMYSYTTQRMWNLKCTIIPAIIGATGIVTRSLKKNWKLYQGNIRWIHYKRQLYLEYHT